MSAPSQINELSPPAVRALDALPDARLYTAASQERIVRDLAEAGSLVLGPVLKIYREGDAESRNLAAKILAKTGDAAVPALSEMALSNDKGIREPAVSLLVEIGGSQAADVLRELVLRDLSSHRRRRRRRRIWRITRIFMICVVGIILITWMMLRRHYGFPPFGVFQILLQLLTAGAVVDATVELRKKAIGAISGIDDIRMVGALAICLSIEDKDTHKRVRESLKRLLPRLKASDSGLLNEQSREELLQEVDRDRSELRIPILKAYEQIGAELELPVVEKLARSASVPIIQETANQCLPAIRQRAEQSRQAHTLLRPAESPDNQGNVLLRPAASAGGDSERLLRTIE